jgi:hypothetical protein
MKSFLIAALVCGAGAVGMSMAACSSSSSGGTGPGDDGGQQDQVTNDTKPPNDVVSNDVVNDNTPPPDGGTCTGMFSGNPTCDMCLNTSCCAELTACKADQECLALVSCVNACVGDGGTLASCAGPCSADASSTALQEGVAVQTCLGTNCSTQCGSTPMDGGDDGGEGGDGAGE